MELLCRTKIDCAHLIKDSDELLTKKCATKHGHCYRIELRFAASELRDHYGVSFVDFALIDRDVVKGIIMRFDHQDITEKFNIHTVEELACQIWNDINSIYRGKVTHKVLIFETDKWGVEFS